MLKALFEWWDRNPDFYWVLVAGPTLLLVAWAAMPVLRAIRGQPDKTERSLGPALLLLLFLGVWRWPWLLCAHDLSPDESQHVAGVLTLAVDPFFFRSVDGSTSGPLNFYAPLPLSLAFGQTDFFTVRLAGLLLMWGTLVLCYRALLRLAGAAVARLGLLPAAIFLATTDGWDFLHYSTEHVPVFFFTLTLWLLVRAKAAAKTNGWLLAAGFVAGLSPWAKLQVGPMSGVLICCGLWYLLRTAAPFAVKARSMAALSLSTLAPTALAVALLALGGVLGIGFQRYVLQNFIYVDDGAPRLESLGLLWRFAWANGSFVFFAIGPLLIAIVGGAFVLWKRRRLSAGYIAGAALTVAAAVCVLLPGRPWQHYLLLLVVPLTLWAAAALYDSWTLVPDPRRRSILAGVVLLVGGLLPLGHRLSQPVPFMFGSLAEHWRQPRSGVTELIHHLARPGDRISLWGYAPEIYAESGRAQGTRDSYTYWSIEPSSQREAYREIYLEDFKRSHAAVFVDAVGPGSTYYRDRTVHGHETFPALASHVSSHYTPIVELLQFRIYLRNDLVAGRRLAAADLHEVIRKGRADRWADLAPVSVMPPDARSEVVKGQHVQMLLPPAAMVWRLTGAEREVQIDYGFHPRALAAGAGNGASITVEIESAGRPVQPVFHDFVEPSVNTDDRKPLSHRFTLPPFPPDSRLVVRTDAGPHGDNAWDWLYMAPLRIRKSLLFQPAQFPGFGRVPERQSASAAYYVKDSGDSLLMQHAPATMTFALNGEERRLTFSFGFSSGAHSGEGRTDGAIFRVERQRAGRPVTVLFERRLDPVARAEDRGRQQATVELVGVLPDDRLLLTIDPAGSDSWDWTHITGVDFQK